MEHQFWHERWAKKEIGFHEGTVNQYLHDHWPELAGNGTGTVLVPLCGKAHDMWWLHDRGHAVIGVELSDVACKDFFEEGQEKAKVHPGEPFTKFAHDDLQLWCGDFFQLVPEDLKHVRLVYDRAALIALPPHMRQDYVDHLTAVIPDGTRILLITLDYDTDIKGPPFNVSDEEVLKLYSADYEIEHILTNTLAKDHPFTKRKGLAGATESVFRLSKR
ncbi:MULTISPECIES: thiopurine S-methyltransferase [Marinobacter]|jgi:thiopurine S-methyltransferase|uniref:thiopurine S-methyltransferase n=1 Tax=Marinobacter TaxID=2742 RepID=UPI000564A691|nr:MULTISPECIES: thiopurine S-methyltransferase [Marinobacter]MAB53916.1 thiopurine S-methyltransferase [Marinobacter sp.]MBJ7301221.1 thiopurine S-methyltransferase [Marinobacter salarius]MBL83223.1 thiopurine S-methyltransferase [Marinobacter sp.]MDM8180875.1 thiopurine S-methyltransferase [Marinobacter salarius]RUT75696.1 thiopurine S-methyltransferase [Marinobacter sp. NP-6]|tara:strand:+ start:1057 stop:1710 length:654 start_codon:yes stop_codon:yes gene_type:complete